MIHSTKWEPVNFEVFYKAWGIGMRGLNRELFEQIKLVENIYLINYPIQDTLQESIHNMTYE